MSDAPGTLASDWSTRGLSSAEVARRVADGRVNSLPDAPTRTVGEIVRANVLTPVNGVVGVLLVFVVIANGIGPDMLFGGVIITNSVIGIVQELRARATLNRLAVLTAPHAVVVRDGETAELDVEQVVLDDLLVLAPGAQVVVDGEVVDSNGLELNESLLTGESDPEHKPVGTEVLSGSFVSSGSGHFRATKIGADSYAASLAEEARKFTLVDSELRQGVNTILKTLMCLIPPIAAILYWRLLGIEDDWRAALSGVVAASVAMVPDGLVLLTSLAFMSGVVTLARRQALLRELASVELLARVDTLCLDKTGTITTGEIVLAGVEPVAGHSAGTDAAARAAAVELALAALAASDPEPNATLAAIGASPPGCPCVVGHRDRAVLLGPEVVGRVVRRRRPRRHDGRGSLGSLPGCSRVPARLGGSRTGRRGHPARRRAGRRRSPRRAARRGTGSRGRRPAGTAGAARTGPPRGRDPPRRERDAVVLPHPGHPAQGDLR